MLMGRLMESGALDAQLGVTPVCSVGADGTIPRACGIDGSRVSRLRMMKETDTQCLELTSWAGHKRSLLSHQHLVAPSSFPAGALFWVWGLWAHHSFKCLQSVERLSFLNWIALAPFSKSVGCICGDDFWVLCSVLLIYVSVLEMTHCLPYYNYLITLETA